MRDARKRLDALEAAVRPADVRAWFSLNHRLACGEHDAQALAAPETPHERKRAILAAHGCPDPYAIDAGALVQMGAGAVLLQPAAGRVADVVSPQARTLTFGPWKVWL